MDSVFVLRTKTRLVPWDQYPEDPWTPYRPDSVWNQSWRAGKLIFSNEFAGKKIVVQKDGGRLKTRSKLKNKQVEGPLFREIARDGQSQETVQANASYTFNMCFIATKVIASQFQVNLMQEIGMIGEIRYNG